MKKIKKTLIRMKPLLLTIALLLGSVSVSYAEWTEVGGNIDGDRFYIDFERIRKHGGYIFFWLMLDSSEPIKSSFLSVKKYNQVDCKLFRFKVLSYVFHKESFGRDAGDTQEPVNKNWRYPSPDSYDEIFLEIVCNLPTGTYRID